MAHEPKPIVLTARTTYASITDPSDYFDTFELRINGETARGREVTVSAVLDRSYFVENLARGLWRVVESEERKVGRKVNALKGQPR